MSIRSSDLLVRGDWSVKKQQKTYSCSGEIALGDDVGGDADNIVVIVDLACDRGESKVWQRRQLDIKHGEAIIPLIPSLGLELELFNTVCR